jgi:hypothetical protein
LKPVLVYVAPEIEAIDALFAARARSMSVSLPAPFNEGVVETSNFPMLFDVASVALIVAVIAVSFAWLTVALRLIV